MFCKLAVEQLTVSLSPHEHVISLFGGGEGGNPLITAELSAWRSRKWLDFSPVAYRLDEQLVVTIYGDQ